LILILFYEIVCLWHAYAAISVLRCLLASLHVLHGVYNSTVKKKKKVALALHMIWLPLGTCKGRSPRRESGETALSPVFSPSGVLSPHIIIYEK